LTDEALSWRLEAAFDAAWPWLAVDRVGGWMVKRADGVSRRSNSANPLGPDARLDSGAMAAIQALYRAAGRPAYVRIPSMLDAGVDAGLEHAGWSFEGESVTLIGPLDGAGPGDAELWPSPSLEWLAASHALNGREPALAAAFDAVLGRLQAPAAFAAVRRQDRIVALGYGVLHDGWLCIEAVAADVAWRGQGLAGQAVSTLMEWAAGQGAQGACLQTQADNHAAQTLYRRLGLGRELYRYHYRRGPA
jgi:ribosomal protein S18 acetylase RimI-like enzyme